MAETADGLDPAEFAESARRAVQACAGLDAQAQAVRLAEDGLLGILAPEDAGGLGLGLAFAVPVMVAAGAGRLEFPLLETMLLARGLAGDEPALAGELLAGTTLATVAWAGPGSNGVAGRAPGLRDARLVLVRGGREGTGGELIPVDPSALEEAPGMDPLRPDVQLRLEGAGPRTSLPGLAWSVLEADATVLRVAGMLGAAEACIGLAEAHVTTRRQFGRPLVAFQAVRHALARQKLGIEGIRGCLARSLAEGNAVDLDVRRAAFAAAAAHAPAVAEGALQLHGGMGFTWDIPVHHHLRQIRQWAAEGAAPAVRELIAHRLIEAAQHYDFGAAA